MKKFLQENRTFIVLATTIVILALLKVSNANAGVLWDSSFADCLNSRIKENSTTVHAAAVRGYCREKFPEIPAGYKPFTGKLDGKTCAESHPNNLQAELTCSYLTRNDK